MSPDPMLSLANVDAGYGETQILTDVSLDVGEGEVVSLVGRNGAGKTTTLRSIVGIVEPTAGSIEYRGEAITGLDAVDTAKRGIALVPEERRIFPELTVRENLELAAYGGATDADGLSIDAVLDTFENLADRTDNDGASLSGGEQQMLTIGRALVSGADCILLDEPTEGLAPYIVQDVMDAVRDLNERGITVLLVEQNVHVALELADRNYVLDRGEIVWEGGSSELEADEAVLDRYLGVSL
ncbi:ABC-type branched-chain amino acid transport systems, ATPase component [Halovivax ruber XH-70]|uniref:ABC-type branched-chain amino acid transport systems, ATPase component n=1 Tax=Halovivax ruber (strain DSM 18193 / JCM 13892 / XH-70) TaxID=797302 RepID=L0IDV3_HALRX|nr:ABC transporter ATP-binding protein [Halovivax ruber]AGB17013.1 ABC-type branched-chain amino acid transport systems, ATPase component [Halovivax ruber XH-70]